LFLKSNAGAGVCAKETITEGKRKKPSLGGPVKDVRNRIREVIPGYADHILGYLLSIPEEQRVTKPERPELSKGVEGAFSMNVKLMIGASH